MLKLKPVRNGNRRSWKGCAMARMTEEIIAIDREAGAKIEGAEREASAILARAEEKKRALQQETERRLAQKKEALFSKIREELAKYETAQRETLKEEIEKLSGRFDRDAIVEALYRQIGERLCRKVR
jgi:vacuolar-type H+-ATPase subunit H